MTTVAMYQLAHRAEGEGFEPPGPLRDRLLSRQLQSTGLCHPSIAVPMEAEFGAARQSSRSGQVRQYA